MPILTQCPQCQKKFRAPDALAGRSVKCPGCQSVVRVPAGESAGGSPAPGGAGAASAWYILTEGHQQMGPVSKEQLDNLATQGRLSFCQIRRGDWQSWKWADDVYPDLPPPKEKARKPAPAATSNDQDSARLVICPDCGNTVSRRATRCPHCGCPAAILQKPTAADGPIATRPPAPAAAQTAVQTAVPGQAPDAAAAPSADSSGPTRSRRWLPYGIAGGLLLLIALVAAPLYLWWRAYSAVRDVVEPLSVPVSKPEPIPEPEDPGEKLLSSEEKTRCIDEASQKMAEHIDELNRQYHLPLAMIKQTMDTAELWKALASPDPDKAPESVSGAGGTGIKPYQSQARELFVECRDWVRSNVKRGACTATDVWATARQWAERKQQAVLQPLGGVPAADLTPAPIPEGP